MTFFGNKKGAAQKVPLFYLRMNDMLHHLEDEIKTKPDFALPLSV
jgi:hypothetical protein